jgi:Domain of unknown function (DUF3943)
MTVPITTIVAAIILGLHAPAAAQDQSVWSIDSSAIATPPIANSGLLKDQQDQADWRAITTDSLRFLLVQHGARIAFRAHVRDGLKGPFFKDYWNTLSTTPPGFWDGDPWFTNVVGHSVQGSTVYRIARVNGASRSQAFWWGVLYSTQFELGLLGEAAIGNIAISPVDLVLTPSAGAVLGVAEEWLVTRLPKRGERFWLITRPLIMGYLLTRLSTASDVPE